MPKRLQIVLEDSEYRETLRLARSRHKSIAEWVRQALESARRQKPTRSISDKMECIRIAARYEFPAGDIDHMLAESEARHGAGPRS